MRQMFAIVADDGIIEMKVPVEPVLSVFLEWNLIRGPVFTNLTFSSLRRLA